MHMRSCWRERNTGGTCRSALGSRQRAEVFTHLLRPMGKTAPPRAKSAWFLAHEELVKKHKRENERSREKRKLANKRERQKLEFEKHLALQQVREEESQRLTKRAVVFWNLRDKADREREDRRTEEETIRAYSQQAWETLYKVKRTEEERHVATWGPDPNTYETSTGKELRRYCVRRSC